MILKLSDVVLFQVLLKYLMSILSLDSKKIPINVGSTSILSLDFKKILSNVGRMSIAQVINTSLVSQKLTYRKYDIVRSCVEPGIIHINYRVW